jgi:hypothetical protein
LSDQLWSKLIEGEWARSYIKGTALDVDWYQTLTAVAQLTLPFTTRGGHTRDKKEEGAHRLVGTFLFLIDWGAIELLWLSSGGRSLIVKIKHLNDRPGF